MKYIAVIETDNYKDFEFFEDGIGKYMVGKDANVKGTGWIPLYFTECEQESVLDKVRTEIEFEVDYRNNMLCAEDVFEIIDKYRTESKDK